MKTINVYSFDEITDEKLRQKILTKYYDINVDSDWYQWTTDQYTSELEKIGFYDVKIGFSGFSSQGDGANFIGAWSSSSKRIPSDLPCIENLRQLLDKIGKNHEFGFRLVKNGYSRYERENSVIMADNNKYFHVTGQYYEFLPEHIEFAILSACHTIMQAIYATLEDEYTYLISDEAIIDTLQANKYYFDSEGVIQRA